MSPYCDHCDLPLDQCVHGRPPTVVAPKPAPVVKKPSPVGRSNSAQSRVETRWVATTRRTPQAAFRPQILEVMRDMDGGGEAGKILDEVERRMAPRLLPGDYDLLQDEARWRRAARFERKDMIDDGLIELIREPGIWQLAPQGFLDG